MHRAASTDRGLNDQYVHDSPVVTVTRGRKRRGCSSYNFAEQPASSVWNAQDESACDDVVHHFQSDLSPINYLQVTENDLIELGTTTLFDGELSSNGSAS